MLRCTPVDPTGALVSWFGFHTPSTLILTVFVRVCLSADWAGTLVLCSSSSLLLLFRLAPFLGFCGFLGGLLSLGFFAPLFLFLPGVGVCWGLCLLAFFYVCLLWLSLLVGCPLASVLFLWFSLRCAAGFLFVGFVSRVAAAFVFVLSSVRLLCVFCSWCWGLSRFCPLSPVAPSCPTPLGWSSGAFWSRQCSAGPSLRVSGCICNGPVAIPLVWCVVVGWLLSALLFMATKASALCGALPSTPCCGC